MVASPACRRSSAASRLFFDSLKLARSATRSALVRRVLLVGRGHQEHDPLDVRVVRPVGRPQRVPGLVHVARSGRRGSRRSWWSESWGVNVVEENRDRPPSAAWCWRE